MHTSYVGAVLPIPCVSRVLSLSTKRWNRNVFPGEYGSQRGGPEPDAVVKRGGRGCAIGHSRVVPRA